MKKLTDCFGSRFVLISYIFGILCGFIFLRLIFYNINQKFVREDKTSIYPSHYSHNESFLLSSCSQFYFDLGTNVGIQIRKLFEPSLYSKASLIKVFDEAFGRSEDRKRNQRLCAVGFEPNPSHTQRLVALETAYRQCGWKVFIFTGTAVSDHDGVASLFTDEEVFNNEWGASIVQDNTNNVALKSQVKLLRFSRFLKQLNLSTSSTIILKVDIEGSEVEVLEDLIRSHGLFLIDYIVIEWHESTADKEERQSKFRALKAALYALRDLTKDFILIEKEDESYYRSNFSLPSC